MKQSRIIIVATTAALALVPFFAGAQSATELQAQIQTILGQIAALQQQLGTVPAVATTSVTDIPRFTPASQSPSANSITVCPVFNFTLKPGARGEAITALQKFLVGMGLLTADSVTGFYGALTSAAVRNFQTQQGIVTSGDAATTGWGVVGKSTSAAIVRACSSRAVPPPVLPVAPGTTSACTAISLVCPTGKYDQVGPDCSHTCVATSTVTTCAAYPPPTTSCTSNWVPSVDKNGCVISYTCGATGQTPGACQYYPVPDCGAGKYAQWEGNDSRGCSLGYSCRLTSSTP